MFATRNSPRISSKFCRTKSVSWSIRLSGRRGFAKNLRNDSQTGTCLWRTVLTIWSVHTATGNLKAEKGGNLAASTNSSTCDGLLQFLVNFLPLIVLTLLCSSKSFQLNFNEIPPFLRTLVLLPLLLLGPLLPGCHNYLTHLLSTVCMNNNKYSRNVEMFGNLGYVILGHWIVRKSISWLKVNQSNLLLVYNIKAILLLIVHKLTVCYKKHGPLSLLDTLRVRIKLPIITLPSPLLLGLNPLVPSHD